MPPPTSVPGFVDLVRKSGVVDDTKLNETYATLSAARPGISIDETAQGFVKAGVLTKFQSKQMRLGRYKKFVLSGKYRILELIGTGGMGAVYLCEHAFMKRLVAIKVLPAEKLVDPSNLERFYREARVIAAMDHPNIVRAYNIEQSENLHYLVMEYVDGTSLQEIVARFGPLDPKRVANYAYQTCVGLQHAHEMGLVHRDIKPGNLLLERTGTIKILDMGLARFFLNTENNDQLTERYDEKCILGTADYLAPEQAISSKVDIRADLYSLGGTMYFMLTGKSPVPDGNVTQKLLFQQRHDPPPIEKYRNDVPKELIDIVWKLTRKKADDRYLTPQELLEAMASWSDFSRAVPPDYEMPDLCPAVAVLTGHMLDKNKIGYSTASLASTTGRHQIPKGVSSGSGPTGGTSRAVAASMSDLCLLASEDSNASGGLIRGSGGVNTPAPRVGSHSNKASSLFPSPPSRASEFITGDSSAETPKPDDAEEPVGLSESQTKKGMKANRWFWLVVAMAVALMSGIALAVAF